MLNILLLSSIPFYPQNFGVELVATWSDGMDTTYGTDVAVTPDGWVYLLAGDYFGTSHYFYVLDGRGLPDSGLKLVNVVYDSVNYISALTLWKDYLYAQTGYGVSVYDISDRANPRFVTRATPPKGEGGGKGVSSARLYIFQLPQDTIIMNDWGSIWSISRPDSPVYLANLGKGIGYYELLYPYLYAVNFNPWQLEVHDISDPRNPKLVYVDSTSFYRLNGCLAIYQDSAGNYFMAQGDFWSNQIGIYSLENPERPEPVGIVYNPYDRTEKMWVHDNRVYATTWNLVVFQGGMDSSHVVGFYYLGPGHAHEVKWANGYVFLTKDDLVVLRYLGDTLETEPRLRVWFSKGKLFIDISKASEVSLGVYDLKGSLVLEKELNLPWGRSAISLNLPSRGIYLALVEAGEQRRVVKCYF